MLGNYPLEYTSLQSEEYIDQKVLSLQFSALSGDKIHFNTLAPQSKADIPVCFLLSIEPSWISRLTKRSLSRAFSNGYI